MVEFIIVGKDDSGADVYFGMVDGVLRASRYAAYRGAVAEHGGKARLFNKDDAERFTYRKAVTELAAMYEQRGDEPDKHFWVNDMRIVEVAPEWDQWQEAHSARKFSGSWPNGPSGPRLSTWSRTVAGASLQSSQIGWSLR